MDGRRVRVGNTTHLTTTRRQLIEGNRSRRSPGANSRDDHLLHQVSTGVENADGASGPTAGQQASVGAPLKAGS